MHAKAFTYKNNIVFNRGQYDPENFNGKKLLAHELTHVIQQNGRVSKVEMEKQEEDRIQRVPENKDFKINGLDVGSASDDSIIRFEFGEITVKSSEATKITRTAKALKSIEINLNGFTSEEGTPAQNTKIVNGRINNVNNLLATADHSGIRHKKPDIPAAEGSSDYRSRRIVEIKPAFVAPGVPSISDIEPCTTKNLPCANAVLDIVPLSVQKVFKSIMALSSPDASTSAHYSTFFGANPIATIQSNLGALIGEMFVLTSAHVPATDCHKDACDSTCSQGASAYVDTNISPAKMIFCESVLKESEAKRSETFIHEALHATPGLMTEDIAYAHTRKMLTLSDAEKAKNTDSYVMLIRMLHDPAAIPTAPPNDTIEGTVNGGEIDFAKKSIAFLEQWLISSKFISGGLYSKVHDGILNPAGWQNPLGWYHLGMQDLSPVFGLTDPGASSPFNVPVKDDKVRLAGIADRYLRMRSVLHGDPVTLKKSITGPEAWSKELGNKVKVLASFFSKSEKDAVRHLILLMVKSMSDVPASLRNAFVEGADKIRARDSVGP